MVAFKNAKVLFCSKSDDENCNKALTFLNNNCDNVTVCLGDWGDDIPASMYSWSGDYIVSYMSKWVIPGNILCNAKIAINFHPAPPERPGASCANFALYDGDAEYGATCHHMTEKVDAGKIIMKRMFPVFDTDDVASLLARTHDFMLSLFYDVISILIQGKELPQDSAEWNRNNFHTRKDLNEGLRKIELDCTKEEMQRRIRATSFGTWKPYIYLHGRKFILDNK